MVQANKSEINKVLDFIRNMADVEIDRKSDGYPPDDAHNRSTNTVQSLVGLIEDNQEGLFCVSVLKIDTKNYTYDFTRHKNYGGKILIKNKQTLRDGVKHIFYTISKQLNWTSANNICS